MQRDPARVAAHHFENHHAIVRLGSRVQAVQCFGSDVECGDETERQFSASEIVVDRFRNAADVNATFIKLIRDSERAFAAEDDERVDAEHTHVGDRFFVDVFDAALAAFSCAFDKSAAVASAENRAAARQQSAHFAGRQEPGFSGAEQSFEAVFDTDDAHAVFARCSLHDRANHGVETGRIAASG